MIGGYDFWNEAREIIRVPCTGKVDVISDIIDTGKKEATIRLDSKKVDDIFCKLHKPGRKTATLEASDDAIRNRMKDKFQ